MDPIEAIRDAQALGIELAPPLSTAGIDSLEAELAHPLPSDLRRALGLTAAVAGAPLELDFTGRTMDVEAGELFPAGVPIAHDGAGNFWIIDTNPDDLATAPVFYLSHDPPVLLYQSDDLGGFLREVFRTYEPDQASLGDDVRRDQLFRIWHDNPGTLDRAAARAGDADLSAFAAALDDRFTFADLRTAEVGMGFSWGRHGPRTELRRHGHQRLFAYAPAERKPRLLRRLLSS
jgi:hypothetical protein